MQPLFIFYKLSTNNIITQISQNMIFKKTIARGKMGKIGAF
jgi:hypothetical protein